MDFAKKQLMKFGWTEGKGLGKNENGISEALKPKLKFDNTGVGHNSSEQFTFNWWENVFNSAADNINVRKSKEGDVKIDLNSDESVSITTKKYIIKDKKNKGLHYGSFLKTAKLTGEGMFDHEDKDNCTAEEVVLKTVNLTDDQLFAACSGRTAHKGARHGLKLNGKLSRIELQEKELAKLFNNNNSTEINQKMVETTEKIFDNFKKVEKTKQKRNRKAPNTENLEIESDSCLEVKKKKKRKRKQEKCDNDENEIELEAAHKRYENFCDRKYNKKLNRKRKREEKQVAKIADMFENCSLEKDKSDDDGFDEQVSKKKRIKLSDDIQEVSSKKIKKKKKNKHVQISNEDAGFCELMNEITDKLSESKSIRKKLRQEKKKYEDERVSNISEVLNKLSTG